jgi:hypothetical protein
VETFASPTKNNLETMEAISTTTEQSVEKMFGLGNEQLRELLEQDLPVPREDLVTKKETKEVNKDKIFNLPELTEFLKETEKKPKSKGGVDSADQPKRISRKNSEEYLKALQLNPYADADDTMFTDEYDIIPSIFGSGKLLNIPVPYLQTGHGMLLLISLLSGFVYSPGNPLTAFPPEIREFIRTGLFVVYSINAVLAVQAFFNAKGKNLPGIFWAVKTLLLGGVAYYEVTQAKDPSKMNESTPKRR